MTRHPDIVQMLKEADGFGALHIIVEDSNIEDENIRYCLGLPEITDSERELASRLLALVEDERQQVFVDAGLEQPGWYWLEGPA